MKNLIYSTIIFFTFTIISAAQEIIDKQFISGFKTIELTDKSRIYMPGTAEEHKLHYRPIDLDIWYPSIDKSGESLLFRDLFGLFEQRATNYQDNGEFSGLTEELAQFYVAESGVELSADDLLNIKTSSFSNVKSSKKKHPIILYMAGFNGMGFENYKVIEELAKNGFIVVSIWSVGRYPGNMTNQKEDMMEQVLDAEFALNYLISQTELNIDFNKIGVLGCSWGGLSAAVLAEKNKNIKSVVSFDGTETYYFGESKKEDEYIKNIHKEHLNKSSELEIDYLYFESGDKLNEFNPTSEFNYFKQLGSNKYYIRYKNSKHSDFLCIPSILDASKISVKMYNEISKATLLFFNKTLNNNNGFKNYWNELMQLENTTDQNYVLTSENDITSQIFGTIVDAKTKKSLSYVNIGILHRETGTVSNNNGTFSLEIKEKFKLDTIRVSMVGYIPQTFLIKDIDKSNFKLKISLEEYLSDLDEIIIIAKAFKKKTLGNKTTSKFISHLFYYGQLGKEIGIKININKSPTYIDEFNFYISYNRFSAKALFRLNIYTIKDGKPDKNILKSNIIIPVNAKQTGIVTVDLRDYGIIVSKDILVALEWIDTEGEINDAEAIQISLGLLTGGTYERQSSQGEMKKILKGMGLGFTLKVRQ